MSRVRKYMTAGVFRLSIIAVMALVAIASSGGTAAAAKSGDGVTTAEITLTAHANSATEIELSWNDLPGQEESWIVERSPSGDAGFTVIATVPAGANSYLDTSVVPATAYFYRVCAKLRKSNSPYSNVASATTPDVAPATPGGLSAIAVSASQINLSWVDNSSNESGFKVERSTSATSGFAQVATVAANVTTYSNTGLTAATTYYYRVRAYNAIGDSAYSGTASATTNDNAPTAPSALVATAVSSSQINLSWTDGSSNETGFKVERSTSATSGFAQIATVGANVTTYSNTGLTAATTYYHRVRSYNAVGDSGYSNTASATTPSGATVPAAPSNLTATGAAGHIDVAWTDNSSNEAGFDLWRRPDGGSWAALAQPGANATAYADATAQPGVLYWYIVRARNSTGSSAWSNSASATAASGSAPPAAPSALSATAVSSTQINLTWADGLSNESGFKVERSLSSTSGFAQIATVAANVTTYSNTGLAAATTYYYRVRSYNATGDSAYSNTASATTSDVAPAAPSGLTATAVSSTQINLSWSDGSSNESGFKVERSLSSTSGFAQIATVAANVTTYSNTGLTAATTYYYRVRAYNGAGDSAYSNPASAMTQAASGPPAAPSNLTASGAADRINLSWSDNSGNEANFEVWRKPDGGSYTLLARPAANATTYADATVQIGVLYWYIVRAQNGSGSSAWSNAASAVAGMTTPAAPTSLTASAISAYDINLAWADNAGNESGFKVERSLSAASGFTQIATVAANVCVYQDTGRAASTTYYYRVRAYNLAGESTYSNTASATTQAELSLPLGTVMDVVSDGAHAYLTSYEYGVVVADVSNPIHPRGVGQTAVGFRPSRLDAQGSLAVATGGSSGIAVVDVSDATAPRLVGSLGVYAFEVALQGSYAYVIDDLAGYLRIISVADPAHPALVSSLRLTGTPLQIAVVGVHAYVACSSALLVVDVSAPAAPRIIGALAAAAQEVTAKPGYAYTDGVEYGGLRVVDTAVPAAPMVVGQEQTVSILSRLAVQGEFVYVAYHDLGGTGAGLRIIDVGNPAAPLTTAACPTLGAARSVDVAGSYAYIADTTAGLQVIDVSDPYRPVIVGNAR